MIVNWSWFGGYPFIHAFFSVFALFFPTLLYKYILSPTSLFLFKLYTLYLQYLLFFISLYPSPPHCECCFLFTYSDSLGQTFTIFPPPPTSFSLHISFLFSSLFIPFYNLSLFFLFLALFFYFLICILLSCLCMRCFAISKKSKTL